MGALVVTADYVGVERFTARVLSDNLPMRSILNSFGASWHRDDLGVVTTVVDVPSPRSLRLPASLVKKIRAVTYQVIKAVG